jgi:uncharacterized protein
MSPTAGLLIIFSIAVGGLMYVKWLPYYHRAIVASSTHSVGHSILTGGATQVPAASLRSAMDYALAYGRAIWQAMVLGLLLGSALQEFAPRSLIHGFLGRRGWRSVAAGAALFVLGWQWSALRLLFGILMVFGVAYLVDRAAGPEQARRLENNVLSSQVPQQDFHPSVRGWLTRFLRLALGLIPEYVVLVLLLGAMRAWLFPQIGPNVANDFVWILALAAAGLIFVIPTAGEVPIVQAMLSLGVGVGPAAALLLTLPPISLPSLAMTKSVFSYRVLAFVAGAVLAIGILAGFAAIALGFHA